MSLQQSARQHRGFALPTVLIASVVLLTVLAVSVTATTAARTALKSQYYTQLAQIAGEAGVAFAQVCLQANGNVPTWTDAKPLTPATNCNGDLNLAPQVNALVVAGGGGGGSNGGGGGGAGGYRYAPFTPISVASYPIVVGGGGAPAPSQTIAGSNGGNSSFNGIVSTGGGGGASRDGGVQGQNGGSGGGGSGGVASPLHLAGTGTSGQGYNGGNGTTPDPLCNAAGGGGGGGGSAGGNAALLTGGNAGNGVTNSISGIAVIYAAGGPGGFTCSPGVSGVAAPGGATPGTSPPANTGGGGAGGSPSTLATAGAAGVVIISYPSNAGIVATGGAITQFNGYAIHRFTASGTFQVTAVGPGTCPDDARCFVTRQGNVRSSFSVPRPTTDADGRAVTIPQNGYVELVRTSNNDAYRTYKQPTVQSAAVPALCSGAAKSNLGWNNASIATSGVSFPEPTAQFIGLSTAYDILPGPTYLRKDVNIVEAGTYTFQATGDDFMSLFVDGRLVASTSVYNEVKTVNVSLSAGCHSIHVELTNIGLAPGASSFAFALRKQGSSIPLAVSDRSWRISAGSATPFSKLAYYAAPNWATVRAIAAYNGDPWTGGPSGWVAQTGDTAAQWVSTNHSFTGTTYPATSYAYFINNNTVPWNVSTATEIDISLACDDVCRVYLDGDEIIYNDAGWATTNRTRLTLSPGAHQVAVEVYNNASGPSAFLFSAKRSSDNVIIDRSGTTWVASSGWYSAPQAFSSYDHTFRPSPDTYDCNCATQGTTNFVSNPSGETNSTDVAGGRATVSRSSLAAFSGSFGHRMTVNEVGYFPRYVYSNYSIQAGQRYTLSGYIRSSVNSRIAYQFIDANNNAIPVNGTTVWSSALTNPGGAWQRYSIATIPIPADTNRIQIWLGVADSTALNTVFDVDAVMMTPGPTLSGYADGTSAGWIWTGTAHASMSSGPSL